MRGGSIVHVYTCLASRVGLLPSNVVVDADWQSSVCGMCASNATACVHIGEKYDHTSAVLL